MSTLERWQDICYELAKQPALLIAGSRKIIRPYLWTLYEWDDSISLDQLGYAEKGHKLNQLKRHYLNQESLNKAVEDYADRVKRNAYGSVGVTTHGEHKHGYTQHGFCIQAFTVTQTQGKDRHSEVDVFYRTTEIVKKFGADLVFFRDVLLQPFEESFQRAPLKKVNFHFANVSVHPMYFLILKLTDSRWEDRMIEIGEIDEKFYNSLIRWSLRNMDEAYAAKFKSAQRVGRSVYDQLTKREINKLTDFLRGELP